MLVVKNKKQELLHRVGQKTDFEKLNLNIIGLMVIPPNDGNEEKYFKYLYETNSSLGLEHLSMGMSADYLIADKYNATFLRIGSSIFGKRD